MSNNAGRIEITENTLLKLLVRRGSNTERSNVVLSEGELGYTVDTRRLFVGDGVTTGAYPTSLFLYFGTGHPSAWASAAEVGDVAYDEIAGGIYRLTSKPYSTSSNWMLFTGPLANRVDGETLQLNNATGVMSVNVLSAAQLDPEFAGLGLEFNGTRELQTTPNQQFDAIAPRDNAFINLPQAIQYGTQGGASVFNMPSYDGAAGAILTTDGVGNLVFATPYTTQTQYMVLSSNQIPVGSIVSFGSGGNFNATSSTIPYGYFLCNGTVKSGTTYATLCSVIGRYYGGTAPDFKVPLLTATNFVYIIKYLEDLVADTSIVTINNTSLTAFNATDSVSTSTLIFPNSGIAYQIGVNDYISKTETYSQVDALSAEINSQVIILSAAIIDLTVNDSRFARKLLMPDFNCGITQIAYQHSYLMDATNVVRGAGKQQATAAGNPLGSGNATTNIDYFVPLCIPFKANEIAISAVSVGNGALFLTNQGNIYVGGSNSNGFLGIGSTSTGLTAFTQIPTLCFNNEPIVSVATSYNNANAAAPAASVYAITDQGKLYGWGYNNSAELGITNTSIVRYPTLLNSASYQVAGVTTAIANKNIKKVVIGGFGAAASTFAIDTDNCLYAAGDNTNGQLGLGLPGAAGNRTIFYPVTSIITLSASPANITTSQLLTAANITVDDVYVGGYNANYTTAYILTGGRVWAAGSNQSLAMGIGDAVAANDYTRFRPVSGYYPNSTYFNQLTGVVLLAINSPAANLGSSVAALHNDATISVWGENTTYSLGDNLNLDVSAPKRPAAPFTGIKKIQFHTSTQFLLTTAGDIYSVGGVNTNGVAGNGTQVPNTSKVKLLSPPNAKFEDFQIRGAGTNRFAIAITNDVYRKEVYCWGYNAQGQLGINVGITPALVPFKILL
jgi:alpha-tubulin suppressor-like RCC1 family protein